MHSAIFPITLQKLLHKRDLTKLFRPNIQGNTNNKAPKAKIDLKKDKYKEHQIWSQTAPSWIVLNIKGMAAIIATPSSSEQILCILFFA